jgi:hypothetical protein
MQKVDNHQNAQHIIVVRRWYILFGLCPFEAAFVAGG